MARVKDEKLGDEISLGDWEYSKRDGGIFVMAGVYAHYEYKKDEHGKVILDEHYNPRLHLVGKLRGATMANYKATDSGQPWLVENTLKAWRSPFDLDDDATYPRITTAYKKFVTVGSVLTPRYSHTPKGDLIENNPIAAQLRYRLAGRWSLDAGNERNEKIRQENETIRAHNAALLANAKGKRRPKGLLEETPEIVFRRTIHVHNVGIKRRHIKTRPACYVSLVGYEAMRCHTLIETIPAENVIEIGRDTLIRNWEMSTPRLPQWLNKDDEARVEDEEDPLEVNHATLCYDDGVFVAPTDEYEGL